MKKLLLSALLVLTPLCVATLTFGQADNDAACRQTIQNTCSKCHTTERICNKLGKADATWPKLVQRMGEKGNLSKETQGVVVDCLTKSADPAALVCKKN